jgi:hypothetical protein
MRLRRLERPHFFDGRLLTAEDLRREQEYHRDRSRLHNRFVHGWGVVSGLRVSLDRGEVVVSPGVALDCAGNELVLPCEARIPLADQAGRRYVTLRYEEVPVGHVPAVDGQFEPSHFREEVAVGLCPANPRTGHRSRDPGCGLSHPVGLAAVIQHGSHWRVVRFRAGNAFRR